MEQEVPFKIFPLQRLSSCHVSAVKPHTVVGNSSVFQSIKPQFEVENTTNSTDCILQKVSPLPVYEEESTESISQLYLKLHREAEKIKKWKYVVEDEVKHKEKKIKEKRKKIEVQQKIIHELQFENGKLRLKVEDMIHENEDLINQSNATRHVCNLLKDTCDRAVEKANKYEGEIDDTRQMYEDLNNNINQMIMAFEELRERAENSRLEIYNQIKQETEKHREIYKEQNLELDTSRKQILELTKDREDQDTKLADLKFQVHESNSRVKELEETSKNYLLELDQHKRKIEETILQLEEANLFLQNAKEALSSRETELQNVSELLNEATKEKEIHMKEIEEIKDTHHLQILNLQSEIGNLKETILFEQKRCQESEMEFKKAKLETKNMSAELAEVKKEYENYKEETKYLKLDLDESIKVKEDLEKNLTKEKSEIQMLLKKNHDLVVNQQNIQEELQKILMENTDLKTLVGNMKDVEIQLQSTLKSKEEIIDDLTTKISTSSMEIEDGSRKIETLNMEISQGKILYEEQKISYEKILKENEEMVRKIDALTKDLKALQKELKESKQNSDQTMKTNEKLSEINDELRKTNESLEEQLNKKEEECRNEHNADKKKNAEKLRKGLENKLDSLKKKVDSKNKTIEELQQENKVLKKQMKNGCKQCSVLETENKVLKKQMENGCKQCSVLETEVNGLHAQIENAREQLETTVRSKQMEIADANTRGETLHKEVEKLKLASEEAIRLQMETDVKCQHKIAEMVALMEKHKNQYDKIVKEKDEELNQLKAKQQEIYSARTLMESDISNKDNEIMKLRMQLQQQKDNKEIQTTFIDTPKQVTKVGDIQNSLFYKKKSKLGDVSPCLEMQRNSDNTDKSHGTSSKNNIYMLPKAYYVKTPPRHEIFQHGIVNTHQQDSAKKKRKVALEFAFHSDSSDQTDILGLCDNEGMFKSFVPTDALASTPIKVFSETSLRKTPCSGLKTSTIKRKMKEATSSWVAISKVDRRRKMKAAEKMFI